jgi:hypothetical protein
MQGKVRLHHYTYIYMQGLLVVGNAGRALTLRCLAPQGTAALPYTIKHKPLQVIFTH